MNRLLTNPNGEFMELGDCTYGSFEGYRLTFLNTTYTVEYLFVLVLDGVFQTFSVYLSPSELKKKKEKLVNQVFYQIKDSLGDDKMGGVSQMVENEKDQSEMGKKPM